MRKLFFVLVGSLVLASCKQCGKEAAVKNNNTTTTTIKENKKGDVNAPEISSWVDSTFQITGPKTYTLEEQSRNETLPWEPAEIDNAFLTNYASVLKWSPDSAYLLDLGTYGAVLVEDENGKLRVEPGEPDTEIALIDFKKSLRARLLMAGPSSTITNGKWIHNDELVIAGTFDKTGNGERDTLLWFIDIREPHFRLYNIKTSTKKAR